MDLIRQQVKVGLQNVTADQAKTAGYRLRANLGYRNRQNSYKRAGSGSLQRYP